MTPEEQFDYVFASAMQDRQALLHFLNGVSAEQAQWHPPDGEWSILEGLEHIMLTEEFFRSNLLTILREAESTHTWDTAPANPVKMSPEALRRREQGFVAAPDVLVPRGGRDFQSMCQALLAERQATREAVWGYRARDLSRLLFPHARYGQRNIYDVIEYSGIHDALHCEQMGRVTRSPGYSAHA
ncbi:MAG: DinB family protein [Candidatus Tectomicrobia bacterium]|uniref:DinB family protein n=1 Tax=Tectimicrobiota bacterium TaxID=2528274 RepID=A0A937VXX2_UNCTE|nr:DinB family protein [Candidatus Tectomicrobia bacterium]